MPVYEVDVPGKGTFTVNSRRPLSDEQAYAAVLEQLNAPPPAAPAGPEPEAGLPAALKKGLEGFASSYQTGVTAPFGAEEAAAAGLARQEALGGKYAQQTGFDRVKQAYQERGLFPAAGEVARQVPYYLAENLPVIGTSLAGARIGATAGAPLGPVGAIVGGIGGAALANLPLFAGSNVERQYETQKATGETPDISLARAYGTAAAQSALEAGGTAFALGKTVIGKVLGTSVDDLVARGGAESVRAAERGLLNTVTRGAVRGAAAEMPVEVSQQILERAQAGLPLLDEEAISEYGEAAYGAILLGGSLGPAGSLVSRSAARKKVAGEKAEQARLQEEINQAEQKQATEAEAARKQTPEYRQELNGKIIELQDELREVEPVAKDKTIDEDVRTEAITRAKEIKEQLKELQAEMKASTKQAGAAPTLAAELAKRKEGPRETPVVDEFGNIVKPKKAAMTEEEYAEGYDREAARMQERNELLRKLREKEEAQAAAKREKTYEETQRGVQNYLAGLEEVEETNTQVLKTRLAEQQQRREEDVAQDITLDRINLVLDNFGLRAAGVEPEVRKLVESKIDEGVVDRTVTKELGIQGLEGRTYRGEQAVEVLPNIKAAIDKLEDQRQKALVSKKELMDDKGQLTPAGYKLVGSEAKLRELKRLQGVIEGRGTPETGVEAALAGRLEAESREAAAPLAVDIEPGKPSGVYKKQAEEANKEAGGRFTDLTALMDDYRKGRFFGEKGAKRDVELASSMRAGLLRDTEEARSEITDSLIKEIAYRRVEQGMRPFTKQEAQEFGLNVDNILAEIIRRSTALPSGYSTKTEIIEPAQMRGLEIVKSALTVTRDTRDLSNRQFGAPQRAIEVLAEAIRQAKETAIAEGKRQVRAGEKPLLKKQYAAAPTDLIKDLDRVLRIENLQPDVANTLEQARRQLEEGGASEGLKELVEEQVGRILRGTDRPFTLERDVTQPGGRRAMAAAGNAELIDEIKTQMRFDAETAQFTGEQMTTVPKGREFREERVQPDLFPETVATERATPSQFQRLQKSGAVRKEKARIEAGKQAAREVKAELRGIAQEYNPENISRKERDLMGRIETLAEQIKQQEGYDEVVVKGFKYKWVNSKDPKDVEAYKKEKAAWDKATAEQRKKMQVPVHKGSWEVAGKTTSKVRNATMSDRVATQWATLDADIKKEVAALRELEKEASRFAKTKEKSAAQQRAAKAAAQQKTLIGKLEAARKKLTQEEQKAQAQIQQTLLRAQPDLGLGLPGFKAVAKTKEEFISDLLKARKEAKAKFKKDKAEYAKLPLQERKKQEEPVKKIKLPSKFNIVPIKSKEEIDAEVAERQRNAVSDLRRKAKVSSPEAMFNKLKEEEKAAVELAKIKTFQLNEYVKEVNAGKAAKNFPKFKKMSAEVDMAKANVRSIRENLRLLKETQYEPEKVKRQAARGPVGGEVSFYDKKFTPDQLRKMSGMGLNAFEGGKSYSVDDVVDFRIGDTAGGGIDLEQANKRMDAVEKKLPKDIKFKYFPTMKSVTLDILNSMERQGVDVYETRIRGGVKPDGTVFIIGENHSDMADLEKTIAHEFVGHYTFEGMLGEDGMLKFMLKIDKDFATKDNESGLEVLAKQLGVLDDYAEAVASANKFYSSALIDGKISEKEVRRAAKTKGLREIIAYTMEKRVDQDFLAKAKRWIQELVGAMRKFFKDMGMDMDFSTSDLFYMMKQANKSFEEGKPIAYKKANGDIDFALSKSKYNAGLEDLGHIASKVVGGQKGTLDKIKANLSGLNRRVQFVDRFAALEEVMKRGLSSGIIDSLKAADVMYFSRMADQRHSFTAEIANNGTLKIKEVKRPDGKVEQVIESERGANLKDISQALIGANVGNAKATGDLFTLYLAAERAERVGLKKLNFEGTISEADLKKTLEFGRNNAAFQKARELYNDYNRGLIDFAVQTGAISKTEGARLSKTNDYIPFYRVKNGVAELIIGSENPIRIGDLKNQPYLQELIGGKEAIMDFFTSSLQNTTLLTDMALRNMATYKTANALQDLGILKANKEKKGIRKGTGPASADTIRFKYNGEDYHAVVDTEAKKDMFGDIPSELIVTGMEGIKVLVPGVVRGLSLPANILRKFITRDPRYALRQIFRDSLAAALTTGANIKPVVDTMGEIKNMFSGDSEAFRKLQARGVLGGQVITGAPEDMQKIMLQLASGKTGWELAMAKLDELAMLGDAGTRMAMYNSFLKQGLSEREATLAALESMNFGRRGVSPSMYYLNAMVPFFNAGVQGIDVLQRAIRGKMPYEEQLKVKQKLFARGALMAAFTMAYAAFMQDDEAYKNATPEQRYSNWFIRIPGIAEPFKIPIPFEAGLIFKSLPEGIYNAAFSDEKGSKIAKDLAKQLIRSLPGNPAEAGLPVPTGLKPFIETALNTSFFTGRDIVDARLEGVEKKFQYTDRTPEILKIIAPVTSLVGLSPVQMENLIRGFTGSMGMGILSTADFALKPVGEAGPVTGRVSQLPLVGGLFQPNDAGRIITEAYDAMSEVQKRHGSYKKLIEEGRREEAADYLKENMAEISLSSAAGQFRQRMGEMTKYERYIKGVPEKQMSPDKKREELDKIRKMKIDYAAQFKRVREQTERRTSP
jgi:hypothetical protein